MSSYEDKIISVLKKADGLHFVREKSFENLRGGKYRYDFYIPSSKTLIEVDGQYHFFPIQGETALKKQKEHDRQKNSYALANKMKLYRIPYWDIDNNLIQTSFDIFKKKYLVTSKWHNDRLSVPKK